MLNFKILISLLVLSLATVNSRFLANSTPPLNSTYYNPNAPCGDCILSNYTYCIKGVEGQVVQEVAPQGYCCKDTLNCTYLKNPNYTCSNTYNTTLDKLRVCPFIKKQCGNSNSLNLGQVGESQCMKLKGLQAGNACMYKVQSNCGVPKFEVNNTQDIFLSYRLVKNSTILPPPKCQLAQKGAPCQCANITSVNGTFRLNCTCKMPQSISANDTILGLSMMNFTMNSSQCACNSSLSKI